MLWRAALVACVLLLGTGAVLRLFRQTPATPPPISASAQPQPEGSSVPSPKTLDELLALSPKQLAQVDIALMNLLCAQGLRGAKKLDVAGSIKRLDSIARQVEFETKRAYHKFRSNPAEFETSEAYFHMLYLFTVLQADVGIRYNPERITPVGVFEVNEVFFADSRDVFIHGLIDDERRMGTCASMPALYVAIGRRLGYPLKLVPAKNHLFIRWEDDRTRMNFDGTGRGLSVFEDNHYRQWPYPITREEEQEFGYLKSMTPAEELTAFLALRGHSLMAMGRPQEAVAAHEAALRVSPESRMEQLLLASMRDQAGLKMARAEYIPTEQLQRGAIPVGIDSPRLRAARAEWEAQQFSRQRRGERLAPGPQQPGVPGSASVTTPDPNPLLKLHNNIRTP